MQLGANSVLFGGYDMDTAFKWIKAAGYDGIEISAIGGMSEHLVLDKWEELVEPIKALIEKYELPILAMEQPSRDKETMDKAMQAAKAINCPIINCGPGGETADPSTLQGTIDELKELTKMAEDNDVILCVKAHVGRAIYNTPSSLKCLEAIQSDHFGLDMDPSHIWRADENPVEAIAAVVDRIKHVHIRDCKGRQQSPGKPEDQANGRGDIDLLGYVRVLHENGYDGPLDLEVIGAKEYELPACVTIAAEARGHMQACLQACGAR
ncbi:MAG: sugar phosphate isomerase/epimerase family protein [Candidatus Sumerlaeia bacterium]